MVGAAARARPAQANNRARIRVIFIDMVRGLRNTEMQTPADGGKLRSRGRSNIDTLVITLFWVQTPRHDTTCTCGVWATCEFPYLISLHNFKQRIVRVSHVLSVTASCRPNRNPRVARPAYATEEDHAPRSADGRISPAHFQEGLLVGCILKLFLRGKFLESLTPSPRWAEKAGSVLCLRGLGVRFLFPGPNEA